MVEFLLLCILIMQIISYHSTAHNSCRYKKQFNAIVYRFPKYLGGKTVVLCRRGSCKGNFYLQKAKEKIREVKHGR